MDAKEAHLIRGLADRIRARRFHERDVLAFLILLRAHARPDSALRELSDFVAHREKDRGALKTYVKHVVDYGVDLRENRQANLQITPVHSPRDFEASVNQALASFNLPAFDRHLTDDLFACVMCLLQGVTLHHGSRPIGGLALGRFRKHIWLCGVVLMPSTDARVVFPALIMENTYCSHSTAFEPFRGLIEAKCVRGRLQLYVGKRRAA